MDRLGTYTSFSHVMHKEAQMFRPCSPARSCLLGLERIYLNRLVGISKLLKLGETATSCGRISGLTPARQLHSFASFTFIKFSLRSRDLHYIFITGFNSPSLVVMSYVCVPTWIRMAVTSTRHRYLPTYLQISKNRKIKSEYAGR